MLRCSILPWVQKSYFNSNSSLFYLIRGSSVEKQWGETAYTKLEEKLGRVIGSLEYIGEKERDERLKREAYWQEQRRKEDIRKELNTKKKSEFNNFKRLLSQSIRWEKSQAIRAFISRIETNPNLTIEGSENVQEWIQWAKCKADWYDPTVERKDEYLSPYGEFHEALLEGKKEIDGYNLSKL